MDRYYSELATEALHKALLELTRAQQHLQRADGDIIATGKWMSSQLEKTKSAVNNRIKDIIKMKKKG